MKLRAKVLALSGIMQSYLLNKCNYDYIDLIECHFEYFVHNVLVIRKDKSFIVDYGDINQFINSEEFLKLDNKSRCSNVSVKIIVKIWKEFYN